MKNKERKLKSWQGWLIFSSSMVVVFCLGLLAASVTERRAEIQSIYANKKDKIAPFEARNEMYRGNYPREYETWTYTADTSFRSEFNGSQAIDYWNNVPTWLYSGPAMPSPEIIHLLAVICMLYRICSVPCEPGIRESMGQETCSLPRAGYVRVPMCHA